MIMRNIGTLFLAILVVGPFSLAGCRGKDPSNSPPPPAEVNAAAEAGANAIHLGRPDTAATTPEAVEEPISQPAQLAATLEPKTLVDDRVEGAQTIALGSDELTSGIPGSGPLKLEEVEAWLADPKNHQTLNPVLPLGLDKGQQQIKGLEANPLTRAKIELGRQLYFDPRLSKDGTISCASCHHPDEGFSRHTEVGIGVDGLRGSRNSPVSYNRILSEAQFWDGRAPSLEEQAKGPIANPIEMANTHEACVAWLANNPVYKAQFDKIFGDVNIDRVAEAIAAFERCVVTGPSPYDYYEELRPYQDVDLEALKEDDPDAYAEYEKIKEAADAHPMSESAIRGREIFFSNKGNCSACHVGPNLTDEKYYNLGVGMDKPDPDLGRYAITMDEKDKGAFKTPTIRNVALSAPYMHDGSQKTLAEVVEWYDKGGHPNPWLNDRIKPLKLTEQEKKDLVAFLEACTGAFPHVEQNRIPQ
jgi:cytochrome c peroxidase